jgi:DNA polymerase delta subunit 2
VAKLLCLEDKADQVALGTLYKDMKLKPTVLKEYTENRTMAAQLGADTFIAATDGLILEDESARIRLTGNLDVSALVTGIVLAVRGMYDAKGGTLDVTDHVFAGAALHCFQGMRLAECLHLT